MFKRLVLMIAAMAVLAWLGAAPSVRAADAAHDTAHAAGEAAKSAAAAPQEAGEAMDHEAGGHAGPHKQPPLLPDPTSRETQLQALWVVIIFIVLLAVLYPTAWRNILIGLKAREQRIRQDIADAEASRKRAQETLDQYNKQLATAENQVRDILAKGAADAEKIATSLKMQAQQEAEEIKERANKDIDAARKAALADIYAQAAELSTDIASKILRRNLNAEDQRDLVNSSLEQFQAVGKA